MQAEREILRIEADARDRQGGGPEETGRDAGEDGGIGTEDGGGGAEDGDGVPAWLQEEI